MRTGPQGPRDAASEKGEKGRGKWYRKKAVAVVLMDMEKHLHVNVYLFLKSALMCNDLG